MEIEENSFNLSIDQRVITLYQAGITSASIIHAKISRTEVVALRTIEKKISLLKKGYPLTPCKRRVRSDKFLNSETEAQIEEFLEANPFSTASDVIRELGYDISERTMQRALKEMNFANLPVKKSPMLTEKQRLARIKFAETNLNRDWTDTIFVDECSFWTHASPNMAYQRQGSERLSTMVPKYPAKVHVFAGISFQGQTEIFIFSET